MAKTRFHYLWRDADNYKNMSHVILDGQLREEDVRPYLEEGELFIPEEVGLEPLFDGVGADDPIWHEFAGVDPAGDDEQAELSASELLERFRQVDNNWNLDYYLWTHRHPDFPRAVPLRLFRDKEIGLFVARTKLDTAGAARALAEVRDAWSKSDADHACFRDVLTDWRWSDEFASRGLFDPEPVQVEDLSKELTHVNQD